MPRKPRFSLPGIPVHVVQRGHNRSAIFFDANNYRTYLQRLSESAERYGCRIHAYVLMTNHVHLLLTPDSEGGVSRMMQRLGRSYVLYFNGVFGKSGTLWEGRYKGSLVQDDRYLLACMRYIEMNPVRAGMVDSPGQYRWSSYQANALGEGDPFVTSHPLYLGLGSTDAKRCDNYRALFSVSPSRQQLTAIRHACQSGTPLGNDRFKEEVERRLQCEVGQTMRGRPQKGL